MNISLFKNMGEYNPKLDYLICKNIVGEFPVGYEEIHIRNCYYGVEATRNNSEINMLKVKDFFLQNEVSMCTSAELEIFYQQLICKEKKVSFKFFDDLLRLAVPFSNLVIELLKNWNKNTLKEYQDLMFRLILVILSLKKQKKFVIPYANAVKKIKDLLGTEMEYENITFALERLFFRTQERNIKHSKELNKEIRIVLNKHKDEFLKRINAKYLGLTGSFALGIENEYSDVDLVVVMEEEFDERILNLKAFEFWKNHIPIKMDIKIVQESKMYEQLTSSMKKTFKKI